MARQNSSSRTSPSQPQKPPAPAAQPTNTLKSEPAPARIQGASASEPSREQISRRAYELFLARGGQHGHHMEDWLQAERELRQGR